MKPVRTGAPCPAFGTWVLNLAIIFSVATLTGCNPQQPITTPASAVEVHYSPAENLEHIDVTLINQARSTIDIAAYSLADYAVADALVQAANRGVKIRIYRDLTQFQGEDARDRKASRSRRNSDDDNDDSDATGSALQRLSASRNIEIRIKHSKTLMHLKSYAVDGQILRTGSANFSPTGEKRQDNDLILFHDAAAAQHFEQNFNAIWSRPDNQPLD